MCKRPILGLLVLPIILSACSVFNPDPANQSSELYSQTNGHYSASSGTAYHTNSKVASEAKDLYGYTYSQTQATQPYASNQANWGKAVNHEARVPHRQKRQYSNSDTRNQEPTKVALRGRKRSKFYASIGTGSLDLGSDVYGVVGRLGVQDGYFGAELEGMTGFTNEKSDFIFQDTMGNSVNGDVSAGVDYSVAAFGMGRVKIIPRLSAHGRLGYHRTRVEVIGRPLGLAQRKANGSFDGVAYGGGLEFDLSPNNALRLDYTAYEYGSSGTTDSLTGSFTRRF